MQSKMSRRDFIGVAATAAASTAITLPSSPASASHATELEVLASKLEVFNLLNASCIIYRHAEAAGVGESMLQEVQKMLSLSLKSPPWVQGTENEAMFKAYIFAGHLVISGLLCLDSAELEWPTRRFNSLITQFSPSTIPSRIETFRRLVLSEEGDESLKRCLRECLDSSESDIRDCVNTFAEQPLCVSLKEQSERVHSPLARRFGEWREKLLSWQLAELRNDAVLSRLGRLYMNEANYISESDYVGIIPDLRRNEDEEWVLSNPGEWPAELPGPGLSETERATLKVREHNPSFVHFAFSRDVEQQLLRELRTEGIGFSIAAIYPPETKALFDRCDRLCAQIEVEELNRKMVFSDHLTKEAAALRNELIEYVCGGYKKPTRTASGHGGTCTTRYEKDPHYEIYDFGLPRPFFFIRRFQDVADATDCYSGKYITQQNAFAWKLVDNFEGVKVGCRRPRELFKKPPTYAPRQQLTYGRRS